MINALPPGEAMARAYTRKLSHDEINRVSKRQLTPEEMFFLHMRVNLSLQEIADLIGYSKQWVGNIITRAHNKLDEQRSDATL